MNRFHSDHRECPTEPIGAVRLTPRPHRYDQRGAARWQFGKYYPAAGGSGFAIAKSAIGAANGGTGVQEWATAPAIW